MEKIESDIWTVVTVRSVAELEQVLNDASAKGFTIFSIGDLYVPQNPNLEDWGWSCMVIVKGKGRYVAP